MEFRILGPLEVASDGRVLELGGPKLRSLLTLLLLEANSIVSRDALVDALWDEDPPETARKALQVYVSKLRKLLGNQRLQTKVPGYVLRVEEGELDLERVRHLHREGRDAEALSLWRGQPLAEFAHQRFARLEIARLEELRQTCLEGRVEADLAVGRHLELVGELGELVASHPQRQRLRGQLMLALYRSGREAEALEAFQVGRRLLVDELGLEPSQELQELHRAILNQDSSLAAPPRASAEPRPTLPTPAHRLIGRHEEVRALRALLLGEARLVTITGAGGAGKTRLALEVARAVADDFGGRAYFVGLAAVGRGHLESALLSALGENKTAGVSPRAALTSLLNARAAFVVLDNFEHLMEDAPLVAELLAECPELKMLVTSRASLHLSSELEYPLAPLPLEHAIDLFAERARAVRPDFAGDQTALAEICAHLDCLPLALELAAARSRLLSPREMLRRIEPSLELLTGGPRDLASRQRTLRATIEWSYELLEPEERRLFARLAVFAGGFTLEAAEDVCGGSVDRLESLVDKNLIRRRESADEGRFSMLETIREYALERLEAEDAVEGACDAYADYYLALARRRVAELDQGQLSALHGLEQELDNFLSAFAWSHGPQDVPVPHDDGGCDHLIGLEIPSLRLESSQGPIDLAELAADRLVLYVYPGTTKPGRPPLPGLYEVPGGRGCTAESRAFRDHATELAALGAGVAGLSAQTLDQQLEFAERARMPFPVIADPDSPLESTLGLPTFDVAGVTLYKRTTLVAKRNVIVKVFYPVFPPDRNADQVVAWLSAA
jgi:predicted ATPase/DNA-binding SARP family transcriptional activator/peroxiredoxin